MVDDRERGIALCVKVCDLTDELRDLWLQRLSKTTVREFMALTVSQQRLLRAVWRMTGTCRPDGVSLRDLAEKLGLSSSAVSVMVESLVKRGYLERITASDDRRKVLIRISSEGDKRRAVVERFFGETVWRFVAGRSPEDVACFEKFMDDFINYLTNKKETEK